MKTPALRTIPGFDGYLAGVDGQIYSTHVRGGRPELRPLPGGEPKRIGGWTNSDGYKMVALYRNGRRSTCKVHTLICLAFHGTKPQGMECCHGPRGRSDNRPNNVSWGMRSKNQGEDRLRDGTDNRGENCAKHKLNASQVRSIRVMDNKSHAEIAIVFGVSKSAISSIKARRSWSWLD